MQNPVALLSPAPTKGGSDEPIASDRCCAGHLLKFFPLAGLHAGKGIGTDPLPVMHRRVRRGSLLFRRGDMSNSLFCISVGFFKTVGMAQDGREQVTGFQMGGDMIGLDAIGSGCHCCDAVALEDADVCVIPFESMDTLALRNQLHSILSREIVREHGVMLMLGSMKADERVAAFLIDLVQRLHARGQSRSELVLRMTRDEIGSYLGLKLETVSRAFSRFSEEGIIEVRKRYVHFLNVEPLRQISACSPASTSGGRGSRP